MAETYYSLTDIVKLCDNLVAAMPTSFYSGIMTVRGGLASVHAADVVPVVRCGECKHSAIDFENRRYCKLVTYYNHVPDDWFCADGERKDGDGE